MTTELIRPRQLKKYPKIVEIPREVFSSEEKYEGYLQDKIFFEFCITHQVNRVKYELLPLKFKLLEELDDTEDDLNFLKDLIVEFNIIHFHKYGDLYICLLKRSKLGILKQI